SDPDSGADPDTDADADTAPADPDSDAHTDADADAHTNAHAHTDPDAHAHPGPDGARELVLRRRRRSKQPLPRYDAGRRLSDPRERTPGQQYDGRRVGVQPHARKLQRRPVELRPSGRNPRR